MGWTHRANLQVEEVKAYREQCSLWSRGGLDGVEIHVENKIIHIPRKELLAMVADDFVHAAISNLESMDTEEVLKYLLRS